MESLIKLRTQVHENCVVSWGFPGFVGQHFAVLNDESSQENFS